MTQQEETNLAIKRALERYEIRPNGTFRSVLTGKEIKGSVQRGYRVLDIWVPMLRKRKRILAHRLTAIRHLPNPDHLPMINHKDGDGLHNDIDNLEWCTASYNVQDGYKRGRITWNEGTVKVSRVLLHGRRYPRQLFWFLAADDFHVARAIWGLDEWRLSQSGVWRSPDECRELQEQTWVQVKPAYEYHLQQIIVADDPLEYIKEHA